MSDAFDVYEMEWGDVVRYDRAAPGACSEHEGRIGCAAVTHPPEQRGRVYDNATGGESGKCSDRLVVFAMEAERVAFSAKGENLPAPLESSC